MSDQVTLEKHYDPQSVEGEIYARWERTGAFRADPENQSPLGSYTIVIPPPNVTGALHLGHALNNTLQDILIRYHRMRGFNTLWQPGTDHAGIATQAVVERRLRETEGKTRHELGREELVRRIWAWKDEYEKRILNQLKMMGCSCDWGYKKTEEGPQKSVAQVDSGSPRELKFAARYECDWSNTRFTLDEGLARAVRHMFFNLFKDGLIFRGKRLVNWDTQLQTAVSDDEVYYETVKGHFYHFKYPVIPSEPRTSVRADTREGEAPAEPEYVVIATTRPETMLGDVAVAVHPDPAGFFDQQREALTAEWERIGNRSGKDSAEIEAKLAALAARRESHLKPLVTLRDMAVAGRKLRLPLVDREIPLITDDWANPMLGSGCVKITPAHDPNDYNVGIRNNLAMINVLTPDGKIAPIIEPDPNAAPIKPGTSENANSDKYAGLAFTAEGRAKVVADLEALGLIEAIEDRDIELSHSDRSKLPIEPYLSDQWFVRTADSEPRTSVRADAHEASTSQMSFPRRSPDLGLGAVLITWTTYGTWLPGDQRGFVSRVPSPQSPHEIHNLPVERYDADDPQVLASAAGRMDGKPVYISREQAQVALVSIAQACARHGIEPLAVSIMANHAHILCQTERPKEELLKLFKGPASRALSKTFQLNDAPRWFTAGESVRYGKSKIELTTVMEYVKNQEHPLASWSFDVGGVEFDSAFNAELHASESSFEHRASARTEVRGSLGLATNAMKAVEDGRIEVFPSRYAKSYLDWLGEKRDWCISRQLWWGHRIGVWTVTASVALIEEDAKSIPVDMLERETTRHYQRVRDQVRQAITDFLSESGIDISNYLIVPSGFQEPYNLRICARIKECDDVLSALKQFRDAQGMREWLPGERRQPAPRFTGPTVRPETMGLILNSLAPGDAGIQQDPDVLDTWFSSALWPFSTLGWPEETKRLETYYPGSVLVTSRDIITNWVARMVMFGLYAMGEVPFRHVYIHPKILDGRGETMSKSKGNGVDPIDIIHTHGADALRYSMADLTTETQDIRMPVDYLCPHCGKMTEQAAAIKVEEQNRKSRGIKLERKLQPADCQRVKCAHKECGKEFATQWADAATKEQLGIGRETSEKFEIGRNFCNKLWNAARYAFMNLEGNKATRQQGNEGNAEKPKRGNAENTVMLSAEKHLGDETLRCAQGDMAWGSLLPEDRWILARLSQTIRAYHQAIGAYQFSASVKELREFFWDCLCDWYIELTKPRLQAETGADADETGPPPTPSLSRRGAADPAASVLAFCLDQVLRLWHPTMPFITERLWQQLNELVPRRGIPGVAELDTDSDLILAPFPPLDGYPSVEDDDILKTFADLQDAVRGVRDLRLQCGVSPKDTVTVTVIVAPENLEPFKAHAHIVRHMAGIGELRVLDGGSRPANSASINIRNLRVFVHDVTDDAAERTRATKELDNVEKQIAGKEGKLRNQQFINNAKPEVVKAESDRLAELVAQRETLKRHLVELG